MGHLAVRLTPGASADRIDGWDTDAGGRPVLKVRVRARPIEGEANEALIRLLSTALGIPKSAVAIQRGGQSRTKRVSNHVHAGWILLHGRFLARMRFAASISFRMTATMMSFVGFPVVASRVAKALKPGSKRLAARAAR